MFFSLPTLFSVALLSTRVSANYGFPTAISAGGVMLQGAMPWTDAPLTQASRNLRFDVEGSVPALGSPDIICGPGSNLAPVPKVLQVVQGANMTFHYGRWGPDDQGPVITWLADCKGDCTKFQITKDTPWFKIAHEGFLKYGNPGEKAVFASTRIYETKKWDTMIPRWIKPGQYIVRQEILALMNPGAGLAKSFVSCHQIQITGNRAFEYVPAQYIKHIPGVYSAADFTTNLWARNIAPYPIPGGGNFFKPQVRRK